MLNQRSINLQEQVSLKRGTFIGVDGLPGRTPAGEFSLFANDVTLLAECSQPLPMTNWDHKKTLKDNEKRFMQRHLDLIVNSELKQFFIRRA